MPLTSFQIEILGLLASRRNPESYVAGGTPLNVQTGRFSSDIDIFNDREEYVAEAAEIDARSLKDAGYEVRWLRQLPAIYSAEVSHLDAATRLEWVADSDFRFFPTVPDPLFGYVLNPADLAVNKLMAAAGRRAVRDLVDLVTVNDKILKLGAVAWAAVEKSPGFTPEGLIAEVRRNCRYSIGEWTEIESDVPIEPAAVMQRLRALLDDAEQFMSQMPSDKAGLLFLKDGLVVEPDPNHLDEYQTHAGSRRGQWPSSLEISTSMLDQYVQTNNAISAARRSSLQPATPHASPS